jgi:peptidoglycan biosynthesis protein MviN/MurJ (putative lipid II flippase)
MYGIILVSAMSVVFQVGMVCGIAKPLVMHMERRGQVVARVRLVGSSLVIAAVLTACMAFTDLELREHREQFTRPMGWFAVFVMVTNCAVLIGTILLGLAIKDKRPPSVLARLAQRLILRPSRA